jgi:hypothetical protein
VIRVLSAYLQLAKRQEAYSGDTVIMQSKGNYENYGEDGVYRGRLDDHDDDVIIGAAIILRQDPLHVPSHDK